MRDSFEKQFPAYDLIPEKKSKWIWPLTWMSFAILLAGVPLVVLQSLSYRVPTPLMVGNNKFTLPSLRATALVESGQNKHVEAIQTFERYFALGGQEADMMAMYAYSLSEIGRKEEALTWARKAVIADPSSKAARLMREALEPK